MMGLLEAPFQGDFKSVFFTGLQYPPEALRLRYLSLSLHFSFDTTQFERAFLISLFSLLQWIEIELLFILTINLSSVQPFFDWGGLRDDNRGV